MNVSFRSRHPVKSRFVAFAILVCIILSFCTLPLYSFSDSFTDVPADAWYASAVTQVACVSLMNGVSETEFAPYANVTRAMAARILASFDGESLDTYSDDSAFTDLAAGSWYAASVNWASFRTLIYGTGNNKFSPDAYITRQDTLVLLYRYAHYLFSDETYDENAASSYVDVNAISPYALRAVSWGITHGLISGDNNRRLNPRSNITRAELACIILKFFNFAGGRPMSLPEEKKFVTFSFDDATLQDNRLVEMLNSYNIKSTFFVCSSWLGTSDTLTVGGKSVDHSHISSDEVASLYAGHEVGSHSLNHPDMSSYGVDRIIGEVNPDVDALSALVSYPVRGFAYPGGIWNSFILNTIDENTDICYARTIDSSDSFSVPEEFLAWDPTCHFDNNVLDHLLSLNRDFVKSSSDDDRIFYIWGHSFELDYNDSWDELDSFLYSVSCRRGITYATNYEVYSYFND